MSETNWTYWSITPPRRWQAGSVGAERKPFYFGCADCDTKEPEIAGYLGNGDGYEHVGLLVPKNAEGKPDYNRGMIKLAMFCKPCFDKRLAK